jgi:hypothetical protein
MKMLGICTFFASALILIGSAAWSADPVQTVHSVTGFYELTLSSPVVQVPVTVDSGTYDPNTEHLSLKPIGSLSYSDINDGQRLYTEPYPYGGRFANQVWAGFGWWEKVRNRPDVWGTFASGDASGF